VLAEHDAAGGRCIARHLQPGFHMDRHQPKIAAEIEAPSEALGVGASGCGGRVMRGEAIKATERIQKRALEQHYGTSAYGAVAVEEDQARQDPQ
jgi:hypothetical protein